ncbi:MAG: DUF4304 domain-containing protein [Ruminococcaceae bacterium]|nr:DUF4304 domain-containing protein [Oscillospiraceae bacterium]
MFGLFKKKNKVNTTQIVDEIESAVYAYLKPYGFKKYGRTLHRFVSEDISQVIHFQSGMPIDGMGGLLCINLGIRVPECFERTFHPKAEKKKYYHEYECTIRSRLGIVSGKNETWYDLRKRTDKIIKSIIDEIGQYVLPSYEVLNSRDAILNHRREYPLLDYMNSLILLEECMIYGHLGDIEKAKELFELHYESAVAEYNDLMVNGHKQYLKKGQRVVFMEQDITAEKDGYVTLYGASHGHIDYLDKLAVELGLR